MRAITAQDRAGGAGGLSLTDQPYPHAATVRPLADAPAAFTERGRTIIKVI